MRARQRFLALAAAGLVATLAPGAFGATAVSAAEPTVEVGWWTRSPGQSAPEGGFAVASAPDGPTTVAAMRVALPGLRSVAVEVVETGGLNQGAAAVRACPTSAAWAAAPEGALAEAPEADCDAGSVDLVRDAAAQRWRADLTPLVRDGALSVVFVPGEAAGAGVLGSEVRFAAPDVTADGAAEAAAGGGGADGPTGGGGSSGGAPASPGPATGPAPAGGGSSPPPASTPSSPAFSAGSTGGFGGSSSGSTAGSTTFAAPSTPTVAPVVGSAPQPLAEGPSGEVALGGDTAAGTGTATPSFTPLSGGDAPAGARWGQAVFFVVVSAVAAVAVAGGNRLRRTRVSTA